MFSISIFLCIATTNIHLTTLFEFVYLSGSHEKVVWIVEKLRILFLSLYYFMRCFEVINKRSDCLNTLAATNYETVSSMIAFALVTLDRKLKSFVVFNSCRIIILAFSNLLQNDVESQSSSIKSEPKTSGRNILLQSSSHRVVKKGVFGRSTNQKDFYHSQDSYSVISYFP